MVYYGEAFGLLFLKVFLLINIIWHLFLKHLFSTLHCNGMIFILPCCSSYAFHSILVVPQDGESGWSSLHRALHFGHLAVAGVLIEAGASLTLEDSKAQTPIDLLSGPVQQVLSNKENNAGRLLSEFVKYMVNWNFLTHRKVLL